MRKWEEERQSRVSGLVFVFVEPRLLLKPPQPQPHEPMHLAYALHLTGPRAILLEDAQSTVYLSEPMSAPIIFDYYTFLMSGCSDRLLLEPS